MLMSDGYYISYYIHESCLNFVAGSQEAVSLHLLQCRIHHFIRGFKIAEERSLIKVTS